MRRVRERAEMAEARAARAEAEIGVKRARAAKAEGEAAILREQVATSGTGPRRGCGSWRRPVMRPGPRAGGVRVIASMGGGREPKVWSVPRVPRQ
jgi:hypothetical protein